MDTLHRMVVTAHIATGAYLGRVTENLRGDRGQASTEYAGILFVIVAIIGALVGLEFTDIGEAIKSRISTAISQVGG